MSYGETKTNLIQMILDDPAGFLTEQLKDRGVLHNTAVTALDVEENPTLMRLEDGDNIRLTVFSWRELLREIRRSDLEFHTQEVDEQGNAAWEHKRTLTHMPIRPDEQPHNVTRYMRGDSLEFFQRVIRRFNLKSEALDCVWFFPLGTRLVREIPGLMLYASNRDKYKWHPPIQLATLPTGLVE